MTGAAVMSQHLTQPIMVWTTPLCGRRARKGEDNLATFLIDLSPGDMQRRLGDALAVYVDAMRYPRGTEDQRASMWLEHTRRHGWKAVAAVEVPDHHDITDLPGAALPAAPMLGLRTAIAARRTSGGSNRWCRACIGSAPTECGSLS